jgi:hypothetical protein
MLRVVSGESGFGIRPRQIVQDNRRIYLKRILWLLSVVFLMSACSSSTTLTRPRAKELLESTKVISWPPENQILLSSEDFAAGVARGYWSGCGNILEGCGLTTEGRKLFSGISHEWSGVAVRVDKPLRKNISITGISDNNGPSEKVVEFEWKIDVSPLPNAIQDLLKNSKPHKGRVLVGLYDDGWRVVQQL